jgi:integrase
MKRKKRAEHFLLMDGCHCTQFAVFPKDWDKPGADVSLSWFIWYRFYDPKFRDDPKFKNGKLCPIKGDINQYNTLAAKRQLVRATLEQEYDIIVKQHYNPITGLFMAPAEPEREDYIIHPDTLLIPALKAAKERIKGVRSTRYDLESVMKGVCTAAKRVRVDNLAIKDIRRRHVLMILTQCSKDIKKWSPNRFNKYRSYLLMLFKELLIIEAIEQNPVTDIPKEKTVKNIRLTLTMEERIRIDEHLRANYYRFWLYTQIFFHAGGRESELMNLKIKDVDLQNQRYMTTILKGKHYRQVWKTIKTIAMPYWHQAVVGGKREDFVFSKGLQPGPVAINPWQITRRWRTHVKEKLGIQADFYSLKALNTDETDIQMGIKVAAAQNSHQGTGVTIEHYAVTHKSRMHEIQKQVNNPFAPKQETAKE